MASAAVKERLRKLRQKFHLGEFRKNKPKRTRSVRVRTVRVKRKRAVTMARHRKRTSHRSSGFGMGGMLGHGIIRPKGIIAQALLGAGAATLAENAIGQAIPYQNLAVGFAVGGVGGAAGAFARDAVKGILNKGSTSSSVYN